MKVLLIGEDKYLADIVLYTLNRNGYVVLTAHSDTDVLKKQAEFGADLVLFDSTTEGEDQYALCRVIRGRFSVPILCFGSTAEEHAVVQAYEAGADDYIVKPFSIRHLLLRIAAVTRRQSPAGSEQADGFARRISIGDIIIDPATLEARKNGSILSLTRIEFRLLHYFVRHAGILLHFDRIADYVWQSSTGGDLTLLRTHVSRLRRKLTAADGGCVEIRAVQRTGYMLTVGTAAAGAEREPTAVTRAG